MLATANTDEGDISISSTVEQKQTECERKKGIQITLSPPVSLCLAMAASKLAAESFTPSTISANLIDKKIDYDREIYYTRNIVQL